MGLLVLFLIAAAVLLGIATAIAVHRLRHPGRKTYGTALARGLCVEPADMGLASDQTSFHLDDGHASPAWIITGRHPLGPVVIFTHGWSDSRYTAMPLWTPLLAPLASHVVFYDMRAHGEAEANTFHGGAREAADLASIIEQVRDRMGSDRPVVLMGHSMGGAISILAAAEPAAGRVAGVVVEGVYRHWYRPLRQMIWRWGWPAEPLTLLVRMVVRLMEPLMSEVDIAAAAERLRCPLLAIHAQGDWMCSLADAKAVAEAAPDGQLVALEGDCHLGLVEEQPQRYFAALASFFARFAPAAEAAMTSDVSPPPPPSEAIIPVESARTAAGQPPTENGTAPDGPRPAH